MSTGFFLVLEGPEGSGKSTLAAGLIEALTAEAVIPLLVREPGGTPAAEALRSELLDADRSWTAERELLYMTTARADLVERVIRPALAEGRVVISDRYDLSTRAYQGAGRGLPETHLEWVNRAATGGLTPDLTLVLDLPAEVATGRVDRRAAGRNRLDRESDEFHQRVAAYYRAATGPGIAHLDADVAPAIMVESALAAIRRARPGLLPSSRT
jgi:dTMP kinase